MKRIIISFSVLIFMMFPFSIVVQAETSNIADYKEYDSFQKRYYEHATELIYLASTSYESNQHYFKENMGLLRQAISSVYDTENTALGNYLDSAESLFAKPVSFLLASNDVRNLLFEKIKSFFGRDEVIDYGAYSSTQLSGYNGISAPQGYVFAISDVNTSNVIARSSKLSAQTATDFIRVYYDGGSLLSLYKSELPSVVTNDYIEAIAYKLNNNAISVIDFVQFLQLKGYDLELEVSGTSEKVPVYNPSVVPADINNVLNNIADGVNGIPQALLDYQPTPQPVLVCPDETIPLSYVSGTFQTLEGQLVTINEDETSNYLQTLCNLDFSFPEIYYHDDTSKLIVGGQDFTPAVSGIDNSLVDYVRNSYNYATSVINSGVNGLKSIIAGTAGLVTFSGSLFGFLPPELLTLFIGGFSVALGLWVFKK